MSDTQHQQVASNVNSPRQEPPGTPSGWPPVRAGADASAEQTSQPLTRLVPVLSPRDATHGPSGHAFDLAARAPGSLPAHDSVRRYALRAEPTNPPAHALRKLATHATVLIVEHEFTNRMLMEKILDIGGYHCVMASNGQEALAVFERERPDLVLTDVSMPIMDGLAATAALRARPEGKHVPIIAVSGHALREDREHALRQGCTEYLVKPYRPHDLLALVARLLRTERG